MNNPGSRAGTLLHFRVVAWAMWDCGSTGLNAIVTTFVFSVYLTSAVGQGLPGGTSPASWLGRAGAVAGLTIGVLAPVVGVWVESPHRRRVALSVLTGTAVALTCAMFLIRDDPRYLWAGLVLLAATAASSDLSSVPYNAMLRQLSTPSTAGRISGFGWASGYVGSVALLLVIYLGFMSGSGSQRGLLQLPVANGLNVRMAMLVAAAWLALLGLPLLLVAHRLPDSGAASHPSTGLLGGYRKLWTEISAEWRRDRNLVYFLVASAIFRDGLAAIFAFGAVLGVNAYGLTQGRCPDLWCGRKRGGCGGGRAGWVRRPPDRVQTGHRRITGRHHRRGAHVADVVGPNGVLGVRAAVVCVHRAGAVVGTRSAAAYGAARQGGCGLWALHDDRPGGVVSGAVVVFGLRRRVPHGPCRARRRVPRVDNRPAAHAAGTGVAARRCADDGAILLAGSVADGQPRPGALAYLNPGHGDRAGDVVADVDDRDASGMQGRL